MIAIITANSLLITNLRQNRGLFNPFNCQVATDAQTHDLLHFREIGERASQQYISNHLLCQPSGSAKVRKKKLLTMSSQLPRYSNIFIFSQCGLQW
jgi:hypothetical protein